MVLKTPNTEALPHSVTLVVHNNNANNADIGLTRLPECCPSRPLYDSMLFLVLLPTLYVEL